MLLHSLLKRSHVHYWNYLYEYMWNACTSSCKSIHTYNWKTYTYTFETFIQIYVKHLHMYLNFFYLCNHMQEIQLWMYKCSTIYIYTAFSYVHAWVFQIDTYKCFTCMHVSISYVCVYDTEVCMYACVFLICMCKCFRRVCIMFYIWACIGLQSMYVCVSVSVVSVRAFQ